MLDLEAIKARAEAATAGPWVVRPYGFHSGIGVAADDDWGDSLFVHETFSPIGHTAMQTSDAEFIVHAREDIPALIAELEAARRAGFTA